MFRPELPVRVAVRQPLSLVHGRGHADAIIKQCLERGTRLLVLDPLMDSIGDLDLNDGPAGRALKKTLLRIRDETDACVLVVHHSNKFGSRGGRQDVGASMENMLGHSSLRNAGDLMVEIRRDAEVRNLSHVSVEKNRNGPLEFGGRLELDKNDGDGSMSVVFLPGDEGKAKTEAERKAKKEAKKEKKDEAVADRDGKAIEALRDGGGDRSAYCCPRGGRLMGATVTPIRPADAPSQTGRGRRGDWSIYFSDGRGRWEAAVPRGTVNGKRRRKIFTGRTASEVRQKKRAWERSNADLLHPSADGVTVERALSLWAETLARDVGPPPGG
jgi:AAA domain